MTNEAFARAFMCFQAQDGEGSNDVLGSTVAAVLREYDIPMVILNACSSAYETGQDNSSIGAILTTFGVSYVIAMRYDIQIASAATAIQTLYQKLLQMKSTSGLISAIRNSMYQERSSGEFHGFEYLSLDWLLPIAYTGEAPSQKYLSSAQDSLAGQDLSHRTALFQSLELESHGDFVGREADILNIETALFREPRTKIVLMYGLRGVGKSALSRHLCWWWAATGLVTKILWLDCANYTKSSALVPKLANLLSLPSDADGSPLTGELVEQSLSNMFSEENCLVVLENMAIAQDMLQERAHDPEAQAIQGLYERLCVGAFIVLIEHHHPVFPVSFFPYHLSGIDEIEMIQLATAYLSQRDGKVLESSDIRKIVQCCRGIPGAMKELVALLSPSEDGLVNLLNSFEPWKRFPTLEATQASQKVSFLTEERWCTGLKVEQRQMLGSFTLLKKAVQEPVLKRYLHSCLVRQQNQPEINLEHIDRLLETIAFTGLLTKREQSRGFLARNQTQYFELHPLLSRYLSLESKEMNIDESLNELSFVEVFSEEARVYADLLGKAHEQQRQAIHDVLGLEADNLLTAMMLAIRHSKVSDALAVQGVLTSYHQRRKSYRDGAAICGLFLDQLPVLRLDGPNILRILLLNDQGRLLTSAKAFDDAEGCYLMALEMLQEIDDSGNYDMIRLLVYHSLGGLALVKSQYTQARHHFTLGCQLYASNPDPLRAWTAMHVRLLIGLAICRIYTHEDDHPTTSDYLKQARELAQSYHDKESTADIDAIAYIADNDDETDRQKRFKHARSYFLRSGEADRVATTSLFSTLSAINSKKTSPEALQMQFRHDLQSALKNDNPEAASHSLILLGKHELDLNHREQAQHYLEAALEICDSHHLRNNAIRVHAYRMLGCIALESSQWNKAKGLFGQAIISLAEAPENLGSDQKDAIQRLLEWAERKYNPMAPPEEDSATSTAVNHQDN